MRKIHVTLTNRKAIFLKPYPQELFLEVLRFHPPNYTWMPRYKQTYWDPVQEKAIRIWDGYIKMLRYDSIGAGLFLAKQAALEEIADVQFEIDDQRKHPKYREAEKSSREYQNDCILAMQKASSTGGLVLNATGSGKTLIAGILFKSLVGTGLFVVDELTLLQQARAEISAMLGENVGIIGNSEYQPERVTVATIQTLDIHHQDKHFFKWASKLDVAIYDEIHQMVNKRSLDSVKDLKPKAVFGLTATLQINKPHVLLPALDFCGPVIYEYPIERGVSEGYLSPGVSISVFVSQVGDRYESYNDAYKRLIVKSKKRNAVVLNLIKEAYKRNYVILLFVDRVSHLHKMSKELTKLNIKHACAYGAIDAKDRMQIKKSVEEGELRVIVANKVFKKGVSIKPINLIIDAAAQLSPNDAIQKYGRGTRRCKDKKGLIYFDIVDRHVEGVTSKDVQRNPFHRAGNSRRKAFKHARIPLKSIESTGAIFEFAEAQLEKILKLKEKQNGRDLETYR